MANTPGGDGGGSAPNDGFYLFRWLLAWALVLVLGGAWARTKFGYVTIYYALAASAFLLLVVNYRWFSWALAPITGPQQPVQPVQPAQAGGSGG